MKNRDRQRKNRLLKKERLSYRDSFGIKDPTAYEAVNLMIREKMKQRAG